MELKLQLHDTHSPLAMSSTLTRVKPRHLRLSIARTVILWTAFVSRSRDLAVVITPLLASMLKYLSKSVFLSIEYLIEQQQKINHPQHLCLIIICYVYFIKCIANPQVPRIPRSVALLTSVSLNATHVTYTSPPACQESLLLCQDTRNTTVDMPLQTSNNPL